LYTLISYHHNIKKVIKFTSAKIRKKEIKAWQEWRCRALQYAPNPALVKFLNENQYHHNDVAPLELFFWLLTQMLLRCRSSGAGKISE
jgi:hypothetical protein